MFWIKYTTAPPLKEDRERMTHHKSKLEHLLHLRFQDKISFAPVLRLLLLQLQEVSLLPVC